MENFTPISALIGGLIIGLSALLLMMFNGRIAGISGITAGTLFADAGDRMWRIAFVLGLIAGPVVYSMLSGVQPNFVMTDNKGLIIAAGLLVGFGTRLGSGCTSGHGVCGLSRLSVRSLVAVLTFMFTGMVTVAVMNMI